MSGLRTKQERELADSVLEAIFNAVKSFRDLGVCNDKIMEIFIKNYK